MQANFMLIQPPYTELFMHRIALKFTNAAKKQPNGTYHSDLDSMF